MPMKTKNLAFIAVSIIITACSSEFNEPITLLKQPTNSNHQKNIAAYETFVQKCYDTRTNVEHYPDFYGGAYLSNTGDFTVRLTKISSENKAIIKELIGLDDLVFEQCSYSYNQLLSVKSIIDNYMTAHSGTIYLDNIQSVYVDVFENKVIVCLKQCTHSSIIDFESSVVKSELIKFVTPSFFDTDTKVTAYDSNNINSDTLSKTRVLTLSTGDCLCDNHINSDSLTYTSVAYRAMLQSGTTGFVTSGLTSSPGNTVYRYNLGIKDAAGITTLSMTQGNINAAFCQSIGTTSIDNSLIYNNAFFTYSTTTPPQPNAFMPGATTIFYGAKTLEVNNGRPTTSAITGANCTITGYGNVVYTGLAMSRYSTQESADCGGLVASTESSRILRVYGVHLIRIGVSSYFVPAYSINQTFGLTIY